MLFILFFLIPPTFSSAPDERVLGGQDAAEGVFPYMVSLQYANQHTCGASILSRNWVLSAAHCWNETYNSRLSSFKLGMGGTILGRQVLYNIKRAIMHPQYNNTNQLTNDIMLFEVDPPITYNINISSVRLSSQFVDANVSTILSGWGYYSNSVKQTSTKLQWITLNTISLAQCQRVGYSWPIRDSNLCTLTGSGKGSCRGDSGGPLVDAATKRQVGVVSFGTPTCGSGYPDVFVRVSSYQSWIEENTDARFV